MLKFYTMLSRKRVLILYITERSGHHSAALALKRALEATDPLSPVLCVNAFRYCFPTTEKIIHALYLFVIKRIPKIWDSMYDKPGLVNRSRLIKDLVNRLASRRIMKLMLEFRPDAVLCTQAFPLGIMASYKKYHYASFSLGGVLTDFAPHSFWVYENADFYVVPSDESKEMLTQKGVRHEKISVLGIPIDPKFSVPVDKNELLLNYGLKEDIPTVMLMGGGHGIGPFKEVLKVLDDFSVTLQIIVVCGLNERLFNWGIKQHFKNRVLVFKFTDQIDKLMSLAGAIITKPGGITTSEALVKSLPMIILNPIPGQEARNTGVLKKCGVAVAVQNPKGIPSVLKRVFSDSIQTQGKTGISAACKALARPEASMTIARLVLEL